MADSKQQDNNALRWREKYFVLCEEQDKTERDLGLLQKALVRISLAADGQDEKLDQHLASLRRLLRKEPVSRTDINTNLQQIEKAILRLDKLRKESGGCEDPLLKLVEQLAQLNLSRDKQRALKRYSQSLRARAEQLSAYPELLNEYSQLQREALAEAFHAQSTSNDKPQGFLSRLLGSEPQATEESGSNTETPKAETAQTETSSPTPVEAAKPKTDKTEPEDTSATDSSSSEEPIEPIADLESVIAALTSLLEQLPLSADERAQAEQLRDELSHHINTKELDRIVSGATELVLTALDKSQKDFEQFLLTLDTQLAEINRFLGTQSNNDKTNNSKALNTAIKGQVGTLSQAMIDATDLRSLKTSVQEQLQAIVSSVDQFVSEENQREEELQAELQSMQTKLALVQGEAQAIKTRLQQETLRALTDTLTQLPNREAFNERLQMEHQRHLRYKNPACLALLDIDHFKQVNDQYGHLVGDRVLQYVAKKIKQSIRKTDFLARYGGEEFILIMPETQLEAAANALDKIRLAVANMPLDNIGSVTLSAGISAFDNKEQAEHLVDQADKALYTAKGNGRNRVEIYK